MCGKKLQEVKILSQLLIKTSANTAATLLLLPTLKLFLSQGGNAVAETQGVWLRRHAAHFIGL